MKKGLTLFCAIALLLLAASPLYAGAIVNKSNQSADYFRTLNRNAGTDYLDIIVFNPAGMSKIDDGAYLKLDVMYITKDYSNTISGDVTGSPGKLDQDEPSIVPGLFAAYKKGKWSGFFSFTIPGGGGEVDWNSGDARTVGAANLLTFGVDAGIPQSLKADSVYYGYTLGGSYAINDVWSLAVGVRYVNAYKEAEISVGPGTFLANDPAIVEYRQEADGISGFLGLNISPTDELNIGLTYFHATKLEFETDMKQDNTGGLAGALAPYLQQGYTLREDLPGQINAGLSYKVTPKLRLETDVTYYLEKSATWDGRLDGQGNSWEWGLMGEWAFNSKWKASLGYLHSEIKMDVNRLLPENPELIANTVGAGAVFSPGEAWDITFGVAKVWYDSETSTEDSSFTLAPSDTLYEKDVMSLFVGVQWKFL